MRCLPSLTTSSDPMNKFAPRRRRARLNSAPTKHAIAPTGTTKKTKLPDFRTAQHASQPTFTDVFCAPHRGAETLLYRRERFPTKTQIANHGHATTYKNDVENLECKTLWRSGSTHFCPADAKVLRTKYTAKTSADTTTSTALRSRCADGKPLHSDPRCAQSRGGNFAHLAVRTELTGLQTTQFAERSDLPNGPIHGRRLTGRSPTAQNPDHSAAQPVDYFDKQPPPRLQRPT